MKKKIIIGALIVLVVGGALITVNVLKAQNSDGTKSSFAGGKAEDVEAQRVTVGEISSSVLVTGGVKEVNREEVIPTISLDITQVLVEEGGDQVTIGSKLFEVDMSTTLDELARTKINYEIQTLQLEKLQNMASDSGSAQIGVELARLSLASAQRAYDSQFETINKNKVLLEEGIISQSEYDAMDSGLVEAESALKSARLSLSRSESDMTTSDQSVEIDIKVQLKNLESLDLTIASLEENISDIEDMMKAPISGVVTSVEVKDGDTVQPMSSIITIMNIDELEIEAKVREYDVKDMAKGQRVLITGDAIAKDEEVIGEVSFVAPIAAVTYVNNRETTAVEIKVKVTEGAQFLKPGYTTDCEIMTELKEEVVIAAYNMFKENKDGSTVVFVVNDDGLVEEREIELGITSDFDAEIISGLSEGDVVITNPSFVIKDGIKANVTNDLDETDEDEMEMTEEEGGA